MVLHRVLWFSSGRKTLGNIWKRFWSSWLASNVAAMQDSSRRWRIIWSEMSITLRLRNLSIAELFLVLQMYFFYAFFEFWSGLLFLFLLPYYSVTLTFLSSNFLFYLLALTSVLSCSFVATCFDWDQFLATSFHIPVARSYWMAWSDFPSQFCLLFNIMQ